MSRISLFKWDIALLVSHLYVRLLLNYRKQHVVFKSMLIDNC